MLLCIAALAAGYYLGKKAGSAASPHPEVDHALAALVTEHGDSPAHTSAIAFLTGPLSSDQLGYLKTLASHGDALAMSALTARGPAPNFTVPMLPTHGPYGEGFYAVPDENGATVAEWCIPVQGGDVVFCPDMPPASYFAY